MVSAASGAVGSVAGQLAKRIGCRAVGIAGGPAKCAYVTETLGLDACIDYKAETWRADLQAATPDGVDALFENVGGPVMDAVMGRMNAFGRIALCGMIAGYDGVQLQCPPRAHPDVPTEDRRVYRVRTSEHWPAALRELGGLVASQLLHFRESVAVGLENAPAAFIGLLKGQNFGKQLVKLV